MSMFISFRSALNPQSFFKGYSMISKANIQTTSAVQLYSQEALGVDAYAQTRKRVSSQFANFADKFRSKMSEFVTDDPKHMIFTEDLKNMAHIAEKSDIELTLSMIRKFTKQTSEHRFGSFVFGPVVMRMFHFLDLPDDALKCFHEVSESGFFDQQISYHILLDLLYRHNRYEDMLRVFEMVQQRQLNMTKFPKYAVVLVMAACFKQNTPESLQYASNLWTKMTDMGSVPLRRAAAFFAGLALNQGAPHIALEVITSQTQTYITVRNIKATALAETGRVEDALPVLRSVLDIDLPSQKDKHTFFSETIERVKRAVSQSNSKDLQREFDNIEKALRDRNLIDNQTLEQLLSQEIKTTRALQDPTQVRLHASYQGNRRLPGRQSRGESY